MARPINPIWAEQVLNACSKKDMTLMEPVGSPPLFGKLLVSCEHHPEGRKVLVKSIINAKHCCHKGNANSISGKQQRAQTMSKMWDDPVGWGKGIPQANDQMFLAEWFLYNFVTIFIVLTLVSLAIMGFFIYRRHKKYGLGPRVVSILYIDGFNLKSIGNILCVVGIIIAIFGLVNTWYDVSYLTVPGESGPTPVGTLLLPFSLLLAIGLVFLIIASIGIVQSKKLGTKYIWRGIRLFLPIILILIVIMALGSLIPSDTAGEDLQGAEVNDIFGSISSSPIGNQKSFDFTYTEADVTETATLDMKWGLGLGGWLLLFAAIILILSGVLEISAKAQFFQPKTHVGKPPKEKRKKSKKKSKAKP